MLWEGEIPRQSSKTTPGRSTEVTTVAGELSGQRPPPPPPIMGARADTESRVWTLRLEAGATWTLPPPEPRSHSHALLLRRLQHQIDDRTLTALRRLVQSDIEVKLEAGKDAVELCCSKAAPIGEARRSARPSVMNSRAELQQAFSDYQRTHSAAGPGPATTRCTNGNPGRFASMLMAAGAAERGKAGLRAQLARPSPKHIRQLAAQLAPERSFPGNLRPGDREIGS